MLQYWHKGGISLAKTCYTGQPEKDSKWGIAAARSGKGAKRKKKLSIIEKILKVGI